MSSQEQRLSLAHRIREARLNLHISQEQLAEYSGMTRHSINQIEMGKRSVSALELQAIASALRCSVIQFLEGPITRNDIEAFRKVTNLIMALEPDDRTIVLSLASLIARRRKRDKT